MFELLKYIFIKWKMFNKLPNWLYRKHSK